MPRGPLPDPHAQRRNAATIPTTELPSAGRQDPPPRLPSWCKPLGRPGRAWWRWAWSTPEACGWSSSLIDVVARRAALVDDLNAIATIRSIDLDELTNVEVKHKVERIAALASGKIAILRAMADLDAQLGFGAKNLAQLRWKIVEETSPPAAGQPAVQPTGSRSRLRVVGGAG